VGGVAYDSPGQAPTAAGFSYLKAAEQELRQVQALAAPRPCVALSGAEATTARVLEGLKPSRYAHLATHGFFDEQGLAEEARRLCQRHNAAEGPRLQVQLERGESVSGSGLRVGLGIRNPLGYTGLVLAGANRPEAAGPDKGIVTGLTLVEQPLEGLQLAVLSACDTGLGELTGGEGVQGLARAFHLAGCPDVVASLWQVHDQATAALMARFYHELWQEKKPPIEALRAAQLT